MTKELQTRQDTWCTHREKLDGFEPLLALTRLKYKGGPDCDDNNGARDKRQANDMTTMTTIEPRQRRRQSVGRKCKSGGVLNAESFPRGSLEDTYVVITDGDRVRLRSDVGRRQRLLPWLSISRAKSETQRYSLLWSLPCTESRILER